MKYQPGLFDLFISPINGSLSLQEDYAFIGDINNRSFASPVIIDMRLDIVELRTILDKAIPSPFILQTKNDILPYAQALDELEDGILKHSKGVIATAIPGTDYMSAFLSKGKLWIGDDDNKPAEKSRIELDNLPSFLTADTTKLKGVYNLYTGSINPLTLAAPTTTLHLQRCNLPDLTVGKLWVGKNVTILEDPLNFGDDRPVEITELPIDNLTNLTLKKIWRGDAANRPVETNDLTDLENRVSNLETRVTELEERVTVVEADILAIEGEIAAIQAELIVIAGEITALQAQVTGLLAAVAILQSQVVALFAAIAALDTYVKSITLSTFVIGGPPDPTTGVITTSRGPTCLLTNIPAGGDVSMGDYRITNLATFSAETWAEMESKQLDGLNFLFIWQLLGGGTR
jgi:uncharacterized coiled-coil protein SlyX